MFRSAVIRLTAWYLAIIMLISLFFSVSLYNVSTSELNRSLRRQEALSRESPLDSLFLPRITSIEEQIEASKHRIQLNLLYYNLVILLLGGAASYFLAKRTLKPIEESLETQKRFTADASHELRTPLTAMKTEIEVALREKSLGSAEAKTVLKSSLEEINKLEGLSNALLSLSKSEEETGKADFTIVSLREVVEEAENAFSKLAKEKKISIETDVTETKIEGNKNSLISLVKILLDNALKYSKANTKVTLTSRTEAKDVILEISDQGSGIDPDDIPFIFNRFYRSDISRSSRNIAGYGLGLAIAKKIVDSHGGKIEVKSIPDKGSTFIVKLPLKQNKLPLSVS